jgi:hypothetical protein
MGFAGAFGFMAAVVLAVIVGTLYNIPEFEDFRCSPYLGWQEKAAFKPLGHGLYKLEINWYMTPFHKEVNNCFSPIVYW